MSSKRSQKEVAETLQRLREEIADEIAAEGAQGPGPSAKNETASPAKRRATRSKPSPEGSEKADQAETIRADQGKKRQSKKRQGRKKRVLVTPPPELVTPSRSAAPARTGGEVTSPPSTAPATEKEDTAALTAPAPTAAVPTAVIPTEIVPTAGTAAPRGGHPLSGSLSSQSVQVADRPRTRGVVDELLDHQKRGRGRVIGIAGLPRHGKTTMADRLRERAAERPGADLRYNKTARGQVNVYYLPGRRTHHALIDMAGEDYRVLGDYGRELPELMAAFLWPVLQKIDGLMLLMALPIVWAGWNRDDTPHRCVPSESERDEMKAAQERMLNAHRMLIKYAVVARNLRLLKRRLPKLNLDAERPPTRNDVDDAFHQAPTFDRPVSVVLSKADLFVGRDRPCLHTPNLPRLSHRVPLGIRPDVSDPLLVAAGHFPGFLEFLSDHVKHFKWTFAQAIEDRSESPSPMEAQAEGADVSSLVGAEGALDFITRHPWWMPGPSTAMAIRMDRWFRRGEWDAVSVGGRRV